MKIIFALTVASLAAACNPLSGNNPYDCSKPENLGYCQPGNDGASPASAPLKKKK